MKLATVIPPGGSRSIAVEVRDGHVVAFDDDRRVVDLVGEDRPHPASGRSWPLADVRLLAPIPEPRAIFGVGFNFADPSTSRERPPRPLLFTKLPSASTAPDGPVSRPAIVTQLDYEGELCVVLGANGDTAGFAVANDLTARDLQGTENQWVRAKGADTFLPWGPWISTPNEVGDVAHLRIQTSVNGELRQDAPIRNLVFSPEEVIAHILETCLIHAGDLLLLGSPPGTGVSLRPPRYLPPGDVVRVEIEPLGAIEHAVVAG